MPNQHSSKYASLTEKDKSYIKVVHSDSSLGWDEKISTLTHKFGINERNIRRWIKKLGFSSYKEVESEHLRAAKLKKYTSKYILITWAQNATPVHKPFWDNILAYAEYLGADVGVIPGKYGTSKADDWWDDDVKDYLDSARQNVHTYLDILSDIKIRPTASDPLMGFEGISGERSSILGHPRVHLKSLPVLNGHPNKLLMTTGACTIKNYTDTREGKRSEFHHTPGLICIEIKDDLTFYIRQITADNDGSFIDLIYSVDKKKVKKIDKCAAFIYGDIHVSEVYDPVIAETNRLFEHLTPRRIVLHDLFNGDSVNHHEALDPIKSYHRLQEGRNLIEKEMDGVYEFIDKHKLLKYKPIVVYANHPAWLDRFVKYTDWKKDLPNALSYMKYSLALLEGKAEKGVFAYLLEERYGDKITCLDVDSSFKILGWELGMHGHLGVHGSKGNIEQFRKLNTKIVVGDYHVPQRKDGAMSVGTNSKLRMGYNFGPSAWMHCSAILHLNGKTQQIFFFEDKITTLF